MFLAPDEVVLHLPTPRTPSDRIPEKPSQRANLAVQGPEHSADKTLRMRFGGANPSPRLTGVDELAGKVNYFQGQDPSRWHTNVATYARVRCQDIYPGVDLVFYGNDERQLEFDFIVAAGADPQAIKLIFGGNDSIRTDGDGNLELTVSGETVRLRQPRLYQFRSGQREEIAGNYRLHPTGSSGASWEVRFQIASYDSARPLVIDPVLSFATFLGGTGSESGAVIAVDSAGDVYLTGTTDTGFPAMNPVSSEPAHAVKGGAFVVKLKGDGSGFIYAAYLGGSSGAQATGIAVDSAGNACVMGLTWSGDFPLVNPVQPNHKFGGTDAFVAKLNPSGNALLYSTFLGGSGSDAGRGITVDANDNAYVTGITTSDDFPTTTGAFQPNRSGGWDAFATKLNADGSAVVYSTYLGGTGDEFSYNSPTIGVDPSGNAHVVGTTSSTDFPTTAGAFQPQYGGGSSDAFVAKFNPTGTALVYSTFLGGSSYDGAYLSPRVDQQGSAYVAGDSGSPDFPLSPGPFSTSPSYPALFTRSGELFVSKLSGDGSSLVYSTRLPGQHCYGIATDSAGSAWIVGDTAAQNGNMAFPLFNPVQATFGGGGSDAFVLKVSPDGDQLQFSSFIGGSDNEMATGIAADSQGNVYAVGQTASIAFPTTNAVQATFGGVADAFVLKLSDRDVTPPVILAAGNYGEPNIVTLDFSESLEAASATNATHYTLDHGGAVLAVSNGVNSRSVRLVTSGLVLGTTYTLTVNGVLDRAPVPNVIAANSQVAFAALGLYRGFLHQEIYDGVGVAGSLAELTNSVKFPDHPDSATDIHEAEIVSGAYYQAGVRLTGWLLPPTSGDYTFFLCGGSQSEFYLSRNESPLNRVPIAFEPCGFGCGGSGPRHWNHPVPGWNGTPLPNVSLPIHLEAGKAYYLEVLASSSATDVLGLAWQPPGRPIPHNFDLPIAGPFLAVQANPQAAALNITLQPQSLFVAEGQMATFTVKATATPATIFYQWRKNGADLAGENEPSIEIAETQLGESGNSYDCVLTIPGASATSQAALLTVTNDFTPPTLLSAEGNISSGHVTLTLSEPVNAGDATNTSNYLLSGGLTVSNAVLLADRRTVVLTTGA